MQHKRHILPIAPDFLALGAIGGGAALVISPTGALIGMPLFELDHTPFDGFLMPGILLFTVLAHGPLLLIIALSPQRRIINKMLNALERDAGPGVYNI